jgi:glutamyl-tRNA reductase
MPGPNATQAKAAELNQADFLVVGVSHRSASAGVRDALFVPENEEAERLAQLRAAGLAEALLLSTCDRVEVLTLSRNAAATEEAVISAFAGWGDLDRVELRAQSYSRAGEEALRHIFAVASSLDSQVLGEPQVLGQVKESHRRAKAAGMVGARLDTALGAAYRAAKRVRGETTLAERPVTLAAAALRVARDLHGDLRRRAALLMGLGEMGELLASELRGAGLAELVVTHPRKARAEAVARRLRCHVSAWEQAAGALAAADVVVSAIGAGGYSISREMAAAALKARRRRPILFVDVAIPGDVEPAVQELEGAFVYDLDDLERLAEQGKRAREAVSDAAWAIIREELEAFRRAHAEREGVPALVAFRQHVEALRQEVLADPSLDAAAATRLLMNRLLHAPSEALRQVAADGGSAERETLERLLARLFDLEQDPPADKDAPAQRIRKRDP